MMLRILLGLLLLFSVKAFGQAIGSVDTLQWNKNRLLIWEDFRAEPVEGIGLNAEAFCMIQANFERPNAFQKTKFEVSAIFDREKSWIIDEYKSDQGLTYFQVMFNLYEGHARELRKDLTNSKLGSNPDPVFQEKYNNTMTNLMNEFNQFRKETKLGSDAKLLSVWKIRVDEKLTMLEDYKD